jgi:hypothetical protein
MTAAVLSARGYAERWIDRDAGGNTRASLERLAREARVSFWTVNNLWIGRAKTVNADVMSALREAYLRLCERQLAALQHELAIEKAITGDRMDDFQAEISALVAKIQAQKGAVK